MFAPVVDMQLISSCVTIASIIFRLPKLFFVLVSRCNLATGADVKKNPIKKYAESQNVTLYRLADICGEKYINLYRWASDINKPTHETIVRLANTTKGAIPVQAWYEYWGVNA
jgi:hypothetical protein